MSRHVDGISDNERRLTMWYPTTPYPVTGFPPTYRGIRPIDSHVTQIGSALVRRRGEVARRRRRITSAPQFDGPDVITAHTQPRLAYLG